MPRAPRTVAAFWQTVTRLDKSRINGNWMAMRNAIAVAAPLGIGIAIGNPLGGVAITTGALNVCYSDGRDPYAQRARRMLAWSCLGAIAVFVGSVTGKYHWAAIMVAAVWAFAGGICVALGTRAGDLGLNTLVTLIVFAARGAMPLKGALIAAALVLAGGLLQTALALLFWPIHRYQPERRVIGKLFVDLANEINLAAEDLIASELSAPDTQTQETLAALGGDHSIEGERLRLLFDQADRVRLSLFLLGRLRSELVRAANSVYEPRALDCLNGLLENSRKLLASAGQCLLTGACAAEQPALFEKLHQLLNAAHSLQTAVPGPLSDEIVSAADVLAGQLRAVTELAIHSIPEGVDEFAAREAKQPWRFQLASWFATLRANLDFGSSSFRHAVRLMVCVAIADAIGRSIIGQRSYWLPMTVAVVLKPDFTTTFSRGALRLCGTFAGLVLATGLYHLLPASPWRQLFLVGIFTFALRRIGPANYGVFSISISGLIVFLIAATGVSPAEVVLQRAIYTAAGGLFALIAYAAWPTWERTQVADALADMLDAYRNYFRAVAAKLGSAAPAAATELDELRRASRRARSNAEASVDRVASEPGMTADRLTVLTSMLASSHALLHAVIGLEAGILETGVRGSPEPFQTLARDVEFTLYFLAATLRGSSTAAQSLPKLRQDHRRLVEARAAFSSGGEFVLIETDRITTALNTLREQVVRYAPN